MADAPKPRYRVYRGGRPPAADDPLQKRLTGGDPPPSGNGTGGRTPRIREGGPVVLPRPGDPPPTRTRGTGQRPPAAPPRAPRRPRRRPRVGRIVGLAVVIGILVLAGWIGYGYLQFRDSMTAANARVTAATRQQLKGGGGSILSDPTTILVLGSDRRPSGAASGDSSRSDSILLVRSDPGKGMLSLLSIPRDLRVDVPGIGGAKVNAAYANGGAPLAIRTVQDLIGSGVPINHVVIVDFQGFRSLIDALGGVTIDNPTKIVSNSFDGHPWRFSKGRITLDGRHALAYARVRENTLDPSDNDTNRGFRQQRVLSALASSLASPRTLLHLPSVGDAIGDPLTTDLTGNELLQLGWRKYRSSRVLHCRLGGTPDYYGGEAVLVSSEENRQVVSMFLGRSAPQPPAPTSAFAPGCTVE